MVVLVVLLDEGVFGWYDVCFSGLNCYVSDFGFVLDLVRDFCLVCDYVL